MKTLIKIFFFLTVVSGTLSCGKSGEKASRLVIEKIRIIHFSSTDSDGKEWDEGEYNGGDYEADLRIRLSRDSVLIYQHTPIAFEDSYSGAYYDFFPPSSIIISEEDGTSFELGLYDEDGIREELIGKVKFNPFEEAAGFPKFLSLSDNNVTFEVFVYYVF